METTTIYRKADVSTAEARKSLKRASFAGSKRVQKIASLEVVAADASAARSAKVAVGDLVYEAVVHLAEFPPAGGDDSDGGGDDAAPAPKKSESGDAPSDDSGSDDDSDGGDDDDAGDGNPFGDKADGGSEEKGLKGDAGIIHLLTEILHAVVKGGLPGGGPDAGLDAGGPDLGGPPPGGPGLPDVGAPPAGGPPLPPPVKEKSPVGGPAFASYDPSKAEISVLRRDASEIGNKAILATLAKEMPTHKVARIQRTGSAKVNGIEVNLPANNFAVVTLTRK